MRNATSKSAQAIINNPEAAHKIFSAALAKEPATAKKACPHCGGGGFLYVSTEKRSRIPIPCLLCE